jgi:hypothetical protein
VIAGGFEASVGAVKPPGPAEPPPAPALIADGTATRSLLIASAATGASEGIACAKAWYPVSILRIASINGLMPDIPDAGIPAALGGTVFAVWGGRGGSDI